MNRRNLLKYACGLGTCGCAAGLLDRTGHLGVVSAQTQDQRLAFARYQVAKMVALMAVDPGSPACERVLQGTGRECAKLGGLAARFRGKPDEYFAAATAQWGTAFVWDREKGVITVTVAEGACGCPLVDVKRTPAVFCHCSVGYQQESFETLFGRPVQAVLKASKLGGNARCIFEVTLA